VSYAQFVEKHLTVSSRSGNEWACLCPFHEEKGPSFSINIEKGLFICYACNERGNFAKLAARFGVGYDGSGPGLDDPGLAAATARKRIVGIEDSFEVPATSDQKLFPIDWLEWWQQDAEGYWAERGITDPKVLADFQLGYATEDDALIIPLHDHHGRPIGAVRRFRTPPPDVAKYKYPKGVKISHVLYGFAQAASVEQLDQLVVVEGSIDALKAWSFGVPAVAILGARASQRQVELIESLAPTSLLLMLDADRAGRAAEKHLIEDLRESGVILRRPSEWPTNCKDVGEMSSQQFANTLQSSERVRRC
jgi:DNA primase